MKTPDHTYVAEKQCCSYRPYVAFLVLLTLLFINWQRCDASANLWFELYYDFLLITQTYHSLLQYKLFMQFGGERHHSFCCSFMLWFINSFIHSLPRLASINYQVYSFITHSFSHSFVYAFTYFIIK